MKTRTWLGIGFAAMAAAIGLLGRTARRDAPSSTARAVSRNPYLDRRGPHRPANVVRPAFGRRSATGARPATGTDNWEAF